VKKIIVLNGPNLNLLGRREPEVYGLESLEDLNQRLLDFGAINGYEVQCLQSNVEGELVNHLHDHGFNSIGIVFNPGGYTHTSVAIRDAIASIEAPVIEVHLSHPEAREEFRHESLVRPVCIGAISGLGTAGYLSALRFFMGVQQEL